MRKDGIFKLLSEHIEDEYEVFMDKKVVINPTTKVLLGFGQEEDENFLVGTQEGLKNLLNASREALEKGESTDYDLGEFFGIKCVEGSYFQEDQGSSIDIYSFVGAMIALLLVSSVVVGFVTIVRWIIF